MLVVIITLLSRTIENRGRICVIATYVVKNTIKNVYKVLNKKA